MEEQLGTCQDMEKRAQVRAADAKSYLPNVTPFTDRGFVVSQARVARIQQIEKDMLRIRTRLQTQSIDSEVMNDSAFRFH